MKPESPELRTLLRGLQPADFSNFLLTRHWTRISRKDQNLLVFKGPEDDRGNPMRLALPRRAESPDFQSAAYTAVELLSAIDDVSFDDMVRRIRRAERDLISLRIIQDRGASAGIPLEIAAQALGMLRDLVSCAASIEYVPVPYFSRMPAIGRIYAEHCLFDRAFEGSFGFTIECPIRSEQLGELGEHGAPFARRVTERILRGLQVIRSVSGPNEGGDPSEDYVHGFNANMYALLVKTLDKFVGAELEWTIEWSPSLLPADALFRPKPITISAQDIGRLSERAERMKLSRGSESSLIRGKVIALRDKGLPSAWKRSAQTGGTVVIWAEDRRKVNLNLGPAEYAAAMNAHSAGKVVEVRVEKKDGGYWTLAEPFDFRVVD